MSVFQVDLVSLNGSHVYSCVRLARLGYKSIEAIKDPVSDCY